MEAPAENKKGLSNKVIIIAAAVIIALLAAVVVLLLTRPAPTDIGDEGVPKIGYATEATVLLDQNSLQAAMDEAMANAKDGNIGLSAPWRGIRTRTPYCWWMAWTRPILQGN